MKTIVTLLLVVLCSMPAWSLTEVKTVKATLNVPGLYHNATVTFDMTGKELVNDQIKVGSPSEAFGVSISNYSSCSGSTPYGPAYCSAYVLGEVAELVDGQLVVKFQIRGSANPYVSYWTLNYSVQISYNAIEVDVFDAATKTVSLVMPETHWVDLHYVVDGGAQQNVRMEKNGDLYTYAMNSQLKEGQTVEYWTTSLGTDGQIYTTDVAAFVVPELPEFAVITFENNTFAMTTLENIEWAILHYTIAGQGQQNVMMTGADSVWSYEVPAAVAGDEIEYFVTYMKSGVATDTETAVIVVE